MEEGDIVENFKQLYSGVYDRMINLCQPIHKRYNVAIRKCLGKFMEAIVVDTEKTAQHCFQYLEDQKLDSEIFLALDYIQVKPPKERLRNIKDPRNVMLLYDVLQYDPSEIKQAILFATNNVLVCETPDDAFKVAYEMEDGHRYDAVALDGTFFSMSDSAEEQCKEVGGSCVISVGRCDDHCVCERCVCSVPLLFNDKRVYPTWGKIR